MGNYVFDVSENTFEFALSAGNLKEGEGRVPLRTPGRLVSVSWKRVGHLVEVNLDSPLATTVLKSSIHLNGSVQQQTFTFKFKFTAPVT